ncbi:MULTISPECIES: ABC transporter ATP-binding protein [unclassified Nocardioides]|uniref:ABC transporter ATP-binding protein n=1 Tax=unclassified Nocardioides TaxID=2615069 RepID=UPI0006F88AD1|nr:MULTISPECIES: ABC transporter ATP-binding protein [unclassified Nocardioides]KQY64473.1 peptide ABC transporter ATP-binding protein [Nocardioides sp. Root140]KRF18259.1 peptide ABC transporter ATP-binding protein [Nocardioides sp. Soil796]
MQTKPEPLQVGDQIMDVDDLSVHFQLGGGVLGRLFGWGTKTVKAVDGVDFTLHKGEVIGLVGESGSGKTTLGRALLGMAPATDGVITYQDVARGTRRVSHMGKAELRHLRTDVQMVFQDPHAALNPTMTIETAVGHPLVIHEGAKGEELRKKVADTLERVGLSPAEQFMSKYPSDLSGGQKQRAVIARSIIMEPQVLVADEPVSMLDMSVRAKILQLMIDLKDDLGLTYVYITHDLASAKFFCDRIAIMYLGRIVEIGTTEEIFANPRHPYTKALLKAIPEPDPELAVPRDLPRGEIPDAAQPPLGCSFHPRCPVAVATCGWESRDLKVALEEHWVRKGDATAYAKERKLLGKLDALDSPSQRVTLGKGNAGEALALLEGIRSENPDEPMWKGVDSMSATPDGVEIVFHEAEDPALRPAGGAEVACVLYPRES